MSITLSTEQTTAYDAINNWLNTLEKPYLTLGGYAGTGKTTLIQKLCAVRDDLIIHLCALTGKAALNVGAKVTGYNITISTIHKFIYRPIVDEDGILIGWELIDFTNSEDCPDLIIVDEASMVSEKIFIDLLNLNIPILFVGDHGQLPPIVKKDEQVDDPRVKLHRSVKGFNIMNDPEIRLEEIHRQALDSPIIRLSQLARKGVRINKGVFGAGVMKINTVLAVEHLLKEDDDWTILTDLNRRRVKLNKLCLKFNGFEQEYPTFTTKVVCLKNNFKNIPIIFNGMLGKIVSVEDIEGDYNKYYAIINLDDDNTFKGEISKHTFNNEKGQLPPEIRYRDAGDLFDFGYCLTVHKAQGSEFKRVFIFGTGWGDWQQQWLYTAITRAKEELYICCDKI